MKTRHLTTIVVASSLMLPITALGQSSAAERNANPPAHSSSANLDKHDQMKSSKSSHAGIKRVDKDKLDSKLTAKELIGKEVADPNGERLGRVHDIGLSQVLPSEFRGMEGDEFASSAISSSSNFSSSATNNLNIYVAVGGVMGVGSDIVSVPADQFGYDAENDRLTLNITEDQFTAIAEDDADDLTFRSTEGYASGAGATSTTGTGAAATDWSRSATGTEMAATDQGVAGTRNDLNADNQEIRQIEQALRNDSELRDIASQVVVAQSGDSILLSGEVKDESQKERVVELVRGETEKDVRDYLRVSSAAE